MSTAQSQPSDAVDRVLHGRYRLVRPIATGGMAEVWEGHDDVLARSVAVKMLLPRLAADEAVRERFRREAIAAARLSHPYVVAIFDTGLEGEQPFIVMELVAGKTLRQRMDAGPLRTGMAVAITDQVAQGLSHAHAAGLVHRDIKPGNILLADDPGGLHVKVTDFGIARATVEDAHLGDTDLTDPGTVMGTMKYIAPELVEGGAADARSDVFSLGVVLYEMLTGRVPFEGATPLATAIARLESDPPRPRQVRAGVPRSLDDITMRCLARDPADRFSSTEELRMALAVADLGGHDDAVPFVQPDPTPSRGAPAAFGASERTWLVPAVIIIAAAGLLIGAGVLLAGTDAGRGFLSAATPGGASGAKLPVVGVRSFDPEGDGSENDNRLPQAVDPDPATTWVSDHYATRAFGNLKSGLGVIVELGGDQRLEQLRVGSPSRGWDAQVYVSPQAATAIAGWGTPVEKKTNITGEATFDLHGKRGRYVLIWVTHLADNGSIEIGDIQIRG